MSLVIAEKQCLLTINLARQNLSEMKFKIMVTKQKIKPWLWAVMRENLSSGVCEQQRGRPACYSLIESIISK